MVRRCTVKKAKEYDVYGGRGITVCDRWIDSFETFAYDMGELPSPQHQLDRINNDGDYEPTNCRWVTPSKNAANRPPNHGSARYRGVEDRHGNYRVAIGIDRRRYFPGTFSSAEEAAWMYDQWALAVWGEDAYTNFGYV